MLPTYCYNLEKTNPGTVTHIKTDDENRFEYLFISIGVVIRYFRERARCVIFVDGAHLKGKYLGKMLLAVGMDDDNYILPVAYGIYKIESTNSWTWFFEKLYDLIGDIEDLSIISDRAASIDAAIRTVFPTVHHGICGHHLLANLKIKQKDSVATKSMFWKACKAYTKKDFKEKFDVLRKERPREYKILESVGLEKWTIAYFPGRRYNMMTSNSAELINALSRYARLMPVCMLIDVFWATMQQWYFQRRNHAEGITTPITPWAEYKMVKRSKKANICTVHPISTSKYEVRKAEKKWIVDFGDTSCTCAQWNLSGIPCRHVIATLKYNRYSDCSCAVMKCYTIEIYRKTFKEFVYPLPSPLEWEKPDEIMIVNPPLIDKRLPGSRGVRLDGSVRSDPIK